MTHRFLESDILFIGTNNVNRSINNGFVKLKDPDFLRHQSRVGVKTNT
jgi:hypothetical protein